MEGGHLREVIEVRLYKGKYTFVTMDNPIRYQTMHTQAMKISLR